MITGKSTSSARALTSPFFQASSLFLYSSSTPFLSSLVTLRDRGPILVMSGIPAAPAAGAAAGAPAGGAAFSCAVATALQPSTMRLQIVVVFICFPPDENVTPAPG